MNSVFMISAQSTPINPLNMSNHLIGLLSGANTKLNEAIFLKEDKGRKGGGNIKMCLLLCTTKFNFLSDV